MRERDFYFDNIKGILILTVLVGHMIEPVTWINEKLKFIYIILYSFHMPAFVFVSGYFSKYSSNRIRKGVNLLFIYTVFQVIYTYFLERVMEYDVYYNFDTPYWILWFLVAIAVYYFIVEFIEINIINALIISIVVILITGSGKIGYEYSLGRILYFMPFFLFGYMTNKSSINKLKRKISVSLVGICFAMICIKIFMHINEIPIWWFYGSIGWNVFGGDESINLKIRLCTYFISLIGIFMILIIAPKRKSIFSYIGKITMWIYLGHGFVIQLLNKKNILANKTPKECLVISIMVSIGMIIAIYLLHYIYKQMCSIVSSMKVKKNLIEVSV